MCGSCLTPPPRALQAGPVDEVRIFREGQCGCVYYKHAEAVPYAVALLNGIWLYGQPIRLRQKTGGLLFKHVFYLKGVMLCFFKDQYLVYLV